MDQLQSTTTERKKGQHLTFEERVIIQTRLKDGRSKRSIAREIGCSPTTICNEIKRGTVTLYNGNIHRYKAKVGQQTYERNRQLCCRHYDFLEKAAFIAYVERHFREDEWSVDACVGRALRDGEFRREQMVCTKTLYAYIDLGLLGIRNIDLPNKLRRSPEKVTVRKNKRVLGRSIEERPASVDSREEFGHWECDLVIGSKSGEDDALLTMIERKTREYWMIRIADRHPENVMEALMNVKAEYSEHFSEIFKTITTDNGSEFASLSDLEKTAETLVYYAHPYTSCEKGSVENHNGLIRRFIPKGKRIDSYSDEQIAQIEVWCNSLPRKTLGYQTPDEMFEAEIDRIYGMAA
ncbi:MAG: IS30 family transposase [Stomatobaculum longum]|nr:IS30 family transposase [Stomatobaculum longum]